MLEIIAIPAQPGTTPGTGSNNSSSTAGSAGDSRSEPSPSPASSQYGQSATDSASQPAEDDTGDDGTYGQPSSESKQGTGISEEPAAEEQQASASAPSGNNEHAGEPMNNDTSAPVGASDENSEPQPVANDSGGTGSATGAASGNGGTPPPPATGTAETTAKPVAVSGTPSGDAGVIRTDKTDVSRSRESYAVRNLTPEKQAASLADLREEMTRKRAIQLQEARIIANMMEFIVENAGVRTETPLSTRGHDREASEARGDHLVVSYYSQYDAVS